jgi:hypothetical protein
MARLYADENFHIEVVKSLRMLGHDVLTSLEAGHANRRMPDEDVLQFAMIDGRAMLTFDRGHFVSLHRRFPAHSGIVVCSQDNDWQSLAQRLDTMIRLQEPLAGKLVRVNNPHR